MLTTLLHSKLGLVIVGVAVAPIACKVLPAISKVLRPVVLHVIKESIKLKNEAKVASKVLLPDT